MKHYIISEDELHQALSFGLNPQNVLPELKRLSDEEIAEAVRGSYLDQEAADKALPGDIDTADAIMDKLGVPE